MHIILLELRFVSVPIRGLFNLTKMLVYGRSGTGKTVSVPIRGLFNLMNLDNLYNQILTSHKFPSPLGDYVLTNRLGCRVHE